MFLSRKKALPSVPQPQPIDAKAVLETVDKAAPVEIDYYDKGQVYDIHRRQYDEYQETGRVITKCECRNCRYKLMMKDIDKRRAELNKISRKHSAIIEELKSNQAKRKEERYQEYKDKTWSKGAYDFKVPLSLVPDYANLVIVPPSDPFAEPNFAIGQFSWKDPDTGVMKFVRAIGIERDGFRAEQLARKEPKPPTETQKTIVELEDKTTEYEKIIKDIQEAIRRSKFKADRL
jgi:hypothetical protein